MRLLPAIPQSYMAVLPPSIINYPTKENLKIPHHPLIVQKNKNMSCLIIMCLRNMHSFGCISFRDLVHFEILIHFVPLHSISLSFHAYSSAPQHGLSSSTLFHYATLYSFAHYPSPFPTLTQWYILIFCDEFTPLIA